MQELSTLSSIFRDYSSYCSDQDVRSRIKNPPVVVSTGEEIESLWIEEEEAVIHSKFSM